MKIFNVGGYQQAVDKENITCTCRWGTIHSNNFRDGEKVCIHIKKLVQFLSLERKMYDGYILVKEVINGKSIGWIGEHRKVVELLIRRNLTSEEAVHHMDHDRANNIIDNLILFKNGKEHKAFENKEAQFGITNNMRRFIEERWKKYQR
jgi:transcription antitermination factor NusG